MSGLGTSPGVAVGNIWGSLPSVWKLTLAIGWDPARVMARTHIHGFSKWLGFLRAWWLGSKRKCPENESPGDAVSPFMA